MLPKLHQSSSVQAVRTSEDFSLNEVKRRQKQLELESQTVENRIKQIRKENEKLSKKVEMAEQLALDVYASRLAQKMKKEQKQHQLSMTDPTKYQQTQYERMHLKKMKQEVKEMKHSDAQLMKNSIKFELMRTNEEQIKMAQNLRLRATLKKEEEKLSQAMIQEKLYEKQQKVRLEQERERQKIIMENEKQEYSIKQLEAQELKLVEKLQATQQRELAVKEKLMAATRLAPEDFDRTYLGGQSIICDPEKQEQKQEEQKEQQEQQEGGQQGEGGQSGEGGQGTQTE
ncbi:unnamed protein product (macronuclear) [Paramecium tetraurelia]|uniref:Trichohyalin-plectin-homology domain-containing protein n=1 Tax=Paramecium tetraurelia TaxID=5888 RepID=A0BLY3_PARTE|nr:uncharacterized protein GSPATT00030184001 [Paramecium tetraurelia]CAK59550.1 unnamed protein product [Paramecium tetraurelia]|eukprot:XP_001426948.1 hypothetical protein (macronuclear) [Paramecium tetraurelia strain d4-2]